MQPLRHEGAETDAEKSIRFISSSAFFLRASAPPRLHLFFVCHIQSVIPKIIACEQRFQ
jgi:hypothetical protein